MGLGRENEIVRRIKGGDALLLWKMFKACGDEDYLNLLIEYNEKDVMNLKPLMEYVYEKKKEKLLSIQNRAFWIKPCSSTRTNNIIMPKISRSPI